MAKVTLVVWFFIDLGLGLAARLLEPPLADVFFTAAMLLLLWMTFRNVLREAQDKASKADLCCQYESQVVEALRTQRRVLISDFEDFLGERYPVEKVRRQKDTLASMVRFRERLATSGDMRRRHG